MFSEILTQMLWQEPDKTLLQEVMRLDLPMCHQIREDLLGGVTFPSLSANVMYGVLSKRLHQSDAGTDLYVGDDEGGSYGLTITALKREDQVAYTRMLESVESETRS
jgi:hypothetical protein